MAQAASETLRHESAPRARPIRDGIGRTLIVIFLIKPIIDLFPQNAIWMGPIRLSPTTVFGVLVFFLLAQFLFGRGRHVPPYGRVFEGFILLNAVSLASSVATGVFESMPSTVAWVFKILDAYVVFSCAYLAAQRYQYTEMTPFLTAIMFGSAIVVVLNVLAIQFDMTGLRPANEEFDAYARGRERGLYYDPGVLANVALYSLITTVFRYHLVRSGKGWWLLFAIVIVICDLYLLVASQSRVAVILTAVSGVVYLSFFQQKWGKLLAPVIAAVVFATMLSTMQDDVGEMFNRFDSDVEALQSAEGMRFGGVGVTSSGEVSFGDLEALGNNRGMKWAEALTDILRRPFHEMLIGNYSFSVGGHSDYIDVISRNGFIGFALFVTLMVGITRRTWTLARTAVAGRERVLHYLAFILALCFALYAIPFRPLGYTTTAWYMWAMVGFSFAWEARRVRMVPGRPAAPAAASGQPEKPVDAAEPEYRGSPPVTRR